MIERLRGLFINRDDVYSVQRPDGAYAAMRLPLTDELLQAHLDGEITLGAYAVSLRGTCKWICLDSDREGGREDLLAIQAQAKSRGLEMYLEESRRGGHLWLFCQPTAASACRRLGLGLVNGYPPIEVYCKQTFLEEDKFGSLVRLPFGIHRKTGQRYQFGDGGLDSVRILSSDTIHNWAFRLHRRSERPVGPTLDRDRQPDSWRVDPQFAFDWISANVTVLDSRGQGHCPLHPPDRSKSFNVSREKGVWVCYHETQENGKFLGGSLPFLLMKLDGIDFPTALKRIGVAA